MILADYLKEIEYAVTRVIDSIWHELNEAEVLRKEIEGLQKLVEGNYSRAQFLQQNSEDSDDFMLGVGIHWDTYFGEDKDQYYKSEIFKSLEARLATRKFSYSSLAGALVQYAKQGLSAAYGKPGNWPNGRLIGSQNLKTIILEARNQSEHWEEGKPLCKVKVCFNTLSADIGPQFGHYETTNLAFEVISILGWRTFTDFESDLLSM